MSFLSLAFPVSGINSLRHLLHLWESDWFSMLAHCILNAIWKTAIKDITEGLTAPSHLDSKAIEIDQVFHNPLVLLHLKILKKGFCITLQVKRSEVLLKFPAEVQVIQEEIWGHHSMFHFQEIRLKLEKCYTLEVRESIVDFGSIGRKSCQAIIEIQLALNKKGAKLFWVGSIKQIRFPDFSTGGFRLGWLSKGGCKHGYCLHKGGGLISRWGNRQGHILRKLESGENDVDWSGGCRDFGLGWLGSVERIARLGRGEVQSGSFRGFVPG